MRGPRGLLRVGLPDPGGGRPLLINFIAFEPVVGDAKGLSELEGSALDGVRGKRLWVEGPVEGVVEERAGREELRVAVACEDFLNGAMMSAEVRLAADRPEEICFAVSARPGSAPIREATLTATMGNYGRLRRLWLAGETISSTALYAGYAGKDFVEKESYPLARIARSPAGDAWAAAASDEPDPAAVEIPGSSWQYRGPPLTQYWRVPAEDVRPDLRVRVNGRRVYWASDREIPGGISFENFEVRQSFVPGQRFYFGLVRRAPAELEPWKGKAAVGPAPRRKSL
jgi:hypothetical protein